MATIANTASATSPAISTGVKTAQARIADNFDQFLTLLTTQLKNQSPLDPLDTNQFTQQLVQFAGVEQQIKTNDTLSALITSNKTAALTSAMNFVGTKVTADATQSGLKDGKAEWTLTSPRSGTATIVIKDSNGNEVTSRTVTLKAGDQSFVWDGKKADGSSAPEGIYTTVISAKDSSAQVFSVKQAITGIVDGVDVSGDTPILNIGGVKLPISAVRSLQRI